jgi:hypothetical protein
MATTTDNFQHTLKALEAVEDGANKWRGRCPVCCESRGLVISKGTKGPPVAAFCKNNCDQRSINAAVAKAACGRAPFTVARFCEMKKLPREWVTGWFGVVDDFYIKDGRRNKTTSVMFPYADMDGQPCGYKHRFSESSHDTAWRKDVPQERRSILYGLPVWPEYAANGVSTDVVTLVEGESDTLTLVYNSIPALGISGAKGWKKEFAQLPPLANASKILVVHELDATGKPDADGYKLVENVAASFPAGKVYRVLLPVKDTNALWVSNTPEQFDVLWDKAVTEAQPVGQPVAATAAPDVAVLDEPTVEDDEPLPLFPRLPGALGELCDGITQDIPYDHKALAAITYVGLELSGRVVLTSDPWLQTRFYGCSITTAAGGKSAADVEIRRALTDGGVLAESHVELSVDSGPALVQALEETPRLILVPDELADQFEKARAGAAGRNSLFGEFLRLYESNTTANRTKKRRGDGGKVEIKNAHFAILGSATTARFENMFVGTGAVASGLQSRFVLSYSEQTMPRLKRPNDAQMVQAATAQLQRVTARADAFMEGEQPGNGAVYLHLTTGAQDAIMEWRPFEDDGDDKMKRVVDHAKRFAMLLAACAGATEVDAATMGLGLQFADYQVALRERLFPKDASTDVQAFENRIIKYLTNHSAASMLLVSNRIKTEDCRGGYTAFNRAWEALLRARKVVPVGTSRKGQTMFALAKTGD